MDLPYFMVPSLSGTTDFSLDCEGRFGVPKRQPVNFLEDLVDIVGCSETLVLLHSVFVLVSLWTFYGLWAGGDSIALTEYEEMVS